MYLAFHQLNKCKTSNRNSTLKTRDTYARKTNIRQTTDNLLPLIPFSQPTTCSRLNSIINLAIQRAAIGTQSRGKIVISRDYALNFTRRARVSIKHSAAGSPRDK